MPPNPKEVKKLEAAIKVKEADIAATSKIAKAWGNKTGPMTPADERVAAGGAHGVHGKVSYEAALVSWRANITQAKNELKLLQAKLVTENSKK